MEGKNAGHSSTQGALPTPLSSFISSGAVRLAFWDAAILLALHSGSFIIHALDIIFFIGLILLASPPLVPLSVPMFLAHLACLRVGMSCRYRTLC